MNNTDKLLRAFIEASGFEIEEVTTEVSRREVEAYKLHREYVKDNFMVGHSPIGNRPKPVYDYKVTKVKPKLSVDLFRESTRSE